MLLRYNLILIGWRNAVVLTFFFFFPSLLLFKNIQLSATFTMLVLMRGLFSEDRSLSCLLRAQWHFGANSGDDIYGI